MSIQPVQGGLGAAIAASLRGAQAATDRLANSAESIAGAAAESTRGAEIAPAPPTGNAALVGLQEGASIETALVDQRQAQRAYQANVTALRTADELQKGRLRLGA
jgi:hypothetical protein